MGTVDVIKIYCAHSYTLFWVYSAATLKFKKNVAVGCVHVSHSLNSSLAHVLAPKYVAECGEIERVRGRKEVGCQNPPEMSGRSRIPTGLPGKCYGIAFPGLFLSIPKTKNRGFEIAHFSHIGKPRWVRKGILCAV